MKKQSFVFPLLVSMFFASNSARASKPINCSLNNGPAVFDFIPQETSNLQIELSNLNSSSVDLKASLINDSGEFQIVAWNQRGQIVNPKSPLAISLVSGEYKISGALIDREAKISNIVAFFNPRTRTLAFEVGYEFIEFSCDNDSEILIIEIPPAENNVVPPAEDEITFPPEDWEDILEPFPLPKPRLNPYEPNPTPWPIPEPIGPQIPDLQYYK